MKYYKFSQNNSGGTFDTIDENVGAHTVVIQAESEKQANKIAESLGIYFDGCDSGSDCSCCGDRWYRTGDHEASEEVEMPVFKENKAITLREYEETGPMKGYFGIREKWKMIIHYVGGIKRTIIVDNDKNPGTILENRIND